MGGRPGTQRTVDVTGNTPPNAFSDNRKPGKARKGVREGWYLNRGSRVDILAGDLECRAHHSMTHRRERGEWGRGEFSNWIGAVHQVENWEMELRGETGAGAYT